MRSRTGGSTACIEGNVLLVGEGSLSSTLPLVVDVGDGGAATDWALGLGGSSDNGGERRDEGGTDDRDML